jgi:AcrR family transcriptional regulator
MAKPPRTRSQHFRKQPSQHRAQQTVEAILDAVVRILKREGNQAITTNRVAKVAGVSIGSIYQYFPDKQALFVALHERHVGQIDRLIESKLAEHAKSSLKVLVGAVIGAMIEAHLPNPELYRALAIEVPPRTDGTKDFSVRLHGLFRVALAARVEELKPGRDLDRIAFVVTHMVESLSHGAVLRRPPGLSLAAAKEEAGYAVLAYLEGVKGTRSDSSDRD